MLLLLQQTSGVRNNDLHKRRNDFDLDNVKYVRLVLMYR